jgi:hypothetical protein
MAVRQVGGKLAGQIVQAEEIENEARLVVGGPFGGAVAAQHAAHQAGARAAVATEAHIVEHGELVEQGGALKVRISPSPASAAVARPEMSSPR